MKRSASLLVAVSGLLTTLTGAPRRAEACGGFFCSQVPIDQSGEQIIFSVSQNHVTAHIQISFQGQAKDFAWVVPVQAKPTLSIGSQTVFTAIQQRTQPQYMIEWKVEGQTCGNFRGGPVQSGAGNALPPSAEGDKGVMVLDMREVGPYETVTLSATDPKALVEWLNKNGFTQPASAEPLIKHYVDLGMFFVALKLQQNAGVGEIQPIVLDMEIDEACVPLVLTQVAAIPNMPVYAYVLSSARVFPRNWFHVAINERKIDWLNNASNYRQVVTDAINEAAGHGFVTEFAGKSDFLKDQIFQAARWDTTKLVALNDPVLFVQQLLQMGFPRDSQMQALLRKHIPMPQSLRDRGITEMQFYNSLAQYRAELAAIPFDPALFVADLDMRVIEPLRKAQAMIDAMPYLTRLFSTVSPEEMNRDPFFHVNPDLPPVSNIHRAIGTGVCQADGTIKDITLTLEGGGEPIKIPGPWGRFGQPVTPWNYAAKEPSASRIELVSAFGQPAVYSAAMAKVADDWLNREDPEMVRVRVPPISVQPKPSGGSSCAFGTGGTAGAGGALALLGLALLAARRRRR